MHQAARSDRRRGPADARGRRGGRASSPATSRTCATRPSRSRRSPRCGPARSATSPGCARARPIPGRIRRWFWDGRLTGGGAIIDLGCHCIEIIRNFVGKGNRPVEVLCHTDTLVHPIADEDNAVALIRFESGAIGQFEVSWTFRGGMDLRDEVAGTHGTIWMNHFLRTGFEMFTRRRRRRLRGREGRDVGRLALPGRRRGLRAGLRGHVQRHVPGDRRGRRRRRRRSTTATWSTRSWTPPIGRRRRTPGRRSSSTGAAAPRRGSRPSPETYEGQVVIKREILPDGRHEADPQGPGSRATSATGWWRQADARQQPARLEVRPERGRIAEQVGLQPVAVGDREVGRLGRRTNSVAAGSNPASASRRCR